MDVRPLVPRYLSAIESCGAGFFHIGETVYTGPVIVSPNGPVDWPVDKPVEGLSINDLAVVRGRLTPFSQ
jgi:uncharacterized protein